MTPPPNAARTRWLQRHFVPAHFLFVVRNGFAVAEGIRRRVGHPIDVAAAQWVRANEMVLEDAPWLDHVHRLRYEDLTEHPDEVIADTLRSLELDPAGMKLSDRSWRFHDQDLPIEKMNHEAIARLSEQDRETIERVAGPLLRTFGYLDIRA